MAGAKAAHRYAKALFGLAQETGRVEEVRAEVGSLGRLVGENVELSNVLLQPLHPAAQRRGVVRAIADGLGVSPLLKNFLGFLIDQRRLVDWSAIQAEYERLADQAAGLTKAHVRSASPLSDEQRARLTRALEQKSGGRIELDVEIDPSLLGGAVAQVGDLVYDGSLRTQLRQLRANLHRG
jgi:F-type H+-transporting ATPase subunit delta